LRTPPIEPFPSALDADADAPNSAALGSREQDGGAVLEEGSRFASYVIRELIGAGSMARVYRAEHETLRRDVALKVLRPGALAGRDALERFLQEARITAGLQHANIVQVFDVGVHDDQPYLAMELLVGDDLDLTAAERSCSDPDSRDLQAVGDGTPVHITIPTSNPWVPLRILALGKTAAERVQADVYLLTDRTPTLLPAPTGDNGLTLGNSAPATQSLLDDLRSDKGMGWVPTSAWLSKVRIDASAPQLAFDLAIDATGTGAPSRIMAGLDMPGATVVNPDRTADVIRIIVGLTLTIGGIGGILLLVRRRPPLSMA